jgi:hypothetical protein
MSFARLCGAAATKKRFYSPHADPACVQGTAHLNLCGHRHSDGTMWCRLVWFVVECSDHLLEGEVWDHKQIFDAYLRYTFSNLRSIFFAAGSFGHSNSYPPSSTMASFSNEIAEVDHLLSVATFEGVKAVLTAHRNKLHKAELDRQTREANQAAAAQAPQATNAFANIPVVSKAQYIPIEDYAWDQGEYNSPTVSIFIDLEGVGEAKDRVDASFTATGFDLKINDLKGKNYRLIKDNLEKNIVPDKSKVVVKANKVVLKLQKVKGEYSYEHWTALTAKRRKAEDDKAAAKKDPMGGTDTSDYFLRFCWCLRVSAPLFPGRYNGHDEGHVRRWRREHAQGHRRGYAQVPAGREGSTSFDGRTGRYITR